MTVALKDRRVFFSDREVKKRATKKRVTVHFWQDVKVAKHTVNHQKLMDGRSVVKYVQPACGRVRRSGTAVTVAAFAPVIE